MVAVGVSAGNTELGARGDIPRLFPPLTRQCLLLAKPTQTPGCKKSRKRGAEPRRRARVGSGADGRRQGRGARP